MGDGGDWLARRERVVCPGVGRVSTLTAASASGATITDADGKSYIDFASGIGVMSVGHSNPAVVEAAKAQLDTLMHTNIHVTTYEPYIALCEKLVEIFPHDLPHDGPGGGQGTKAVLVNTGAEAVENSIKIARQATGRPSVICFTGGFHGRTLLAATLTSKINYKIGCGPFAPEVYRLPYPKNAPGENLTDDQLSARELDRLRAAFKDTVSANDVAAIIIEVVQGEGGFHVAPPAYLRGLRELCDEHGIVLIFDEVQSGFCRTGKWAAYEHAGVYPDLSPWAKAMGGGLPIACVIGKSSVMDKVTPGTVGGTYGGNPVACAASLAAIAEMERLDLNSAAAHSGELIKRGLESIASKCPMVTDIRGMGAMMAIQFSEDGDPTKPAASFVSGVITDCLERGLIVIPAGVYSDAIRVLAPLTISDDELSRGLAILEDVVLERAGIPAATA